MSETRGPYGSAPGIDKKDLRVDVYTAGFTRNPVVRIVHLPTRLTATCDDTASQLLNYDGAIKILKAKLAER